MPNIIDGKAHSARIRESLKEEIALFKEQTSVTPGLAVILAGDDPASYVYVRNKIKACEELGIKSFAYYLPASVSEGELLGLIDRLNSDVNVHGILVQLPLPEGLDEESIISRIDYKKDVDGIHAVNAGKLLRGADALLPCTPAGCIELIKSVTEISGKRAVVVGRSNLVGKPLAIMLLAQNATVTICHSRTRDLKEICRSAEILCVAVGRPNFITADTVKEGAVVIDVGINRVDGRLCGDVKFDEVSLKASHITPVPGGVGPMTITMLLSNTLKAARLQCGR
ncbi:MAG: bifunctional methylenetetrahydrofolate dehydrogenase/methenyltetrahydrofolate cyclohydrolase FolD [Clostridiales bacterium]|jgi:methylenetetrahydrofolate dehydrogenase (NADP+)/methenyltetrahydrofolate cyclohydrolase|nr:bifunctional methylenetetrahydrofolate dehydrogenase/methenyltetrahydrofolate cyclohydrolase FolD [Clostridiales bacterium]